jgi:Arc/MetJ-type ribon-helix-helix transcriptional regulator
MSKRRVTVTIDDDMLEKISSAVTQGRAESVSAWVNEAVTARHLRDQRLQNLSALLADYEAEHGEITPDELADQAQHDRDAAALSRAEASRAV